MGPRAGHDYDHHMRTGSPALHRLQLGRELRQLRERAGVSREAAATELDCDLSKISKVERGLQAVPHAEIRLLLTLYGAADDVVERTLQLGRDARRRSTYRVPDWFRTYIGWEQAATEIRTYQSELVPGLLQTPAYVRAVSLAADPTRAPTEIDQLVEARRDRQAVLLGDRPPQLKVVLNEAVIRRPVGGHDVMREQLHHILELADLPTVSVQLMAYSAGAHAAMGGSFVVLHLADPDMQVVYLDDPYSADYLDRPNQVSPYERMFDRLCAASLDAARSRAMIEKAAGDMT